MKAVAPSSLESGLCRACCVTSLFAALAVLWPGASRAQVFDEAFDAQIRASTAPPWVELSETETLALVAGGERLIVPQRYHTFLLDWPGL